jgi:hypothetical protein
VRFISGAQQKNAWQKKHMANMLFVVRPKKCMTKILFAVRFIHHAGKYFLDLPHFEQMKHHRYF